MIFCVARNQGEPVVDSSFAGDGPGTRNGTVLQIYAYAVRVRSDLKNPYQEFRPSATNIYNRACEVSGNEVDQFGSAVFRQRSHERQVEVKRRKVGRHSARVRQGKEPLRSEEHTSELQSQFHLVCRLLL